MRSDLSFPEVSGAPLGSSGQFSGPRGPAGPLHDGRGLLSPTAPLRADLLLLLGGVVQLLPALRRQPGLGGQHLSAFPLRLVVDGDRWLPGMGAVAVRDAHAWVDGPVRSDHGRPGVGVSPLPFGHPPREGDLSMARPRCLAPEPPRRPARSSR